MSRKRIAVFGAGIFPYQASKGIPSLVQMLQMISAEYDVTIYSHLPLLQSAVPSGIYVRPTPFANRRLRLAVLIILFVYDHFRRKYLLIQSHSSHPDPVITVVLGKLLGLPTIVGYNAGEFVYLPEIDFGGLQSAKQAKVNSWVVNNATVITAVSAFHANTMKAYLRKRQKLRVIYRGVDLLRFKYAERPLSSPVQFIHVGYLHPVKDQTMLLKTFATLLKSIDAELHLVGRDFCQGKIQMLSHEMGLGGHVHFHDHLAHEQVSMLLRKCDILLHTSRYDAVAVAAAEAMSSGVLVCGTHVGLLADLAGQCCFTVAPGDHEALASGVLELVHNQEKAQQLKKNAFDWIRDHDIHWAVGEYKKLYVHLAGL